jgi:hypothetical protein
VLAGRLSDCGYGTREVQTVACAIGRLNVVGIRALNSADLGRAVVS